MNAEQLSPTGRFERILLATDGSEYAAGATREAIAIAAKCGAQLHVVTVVRTNAEYESLAPKLVEQAEAQARERLDAVSTQAQAAGLACETLIRHGEDAYPEIVAAAEATNADVIVMGRRGRSGLMRLMMGGNTGRVIGHARCAVLVVPRAAGIIGKPLLLATDGSRHGDAAAQSAVALAKRCGAALTVLSVAGDGKSLDEAQRVVDRSIALIGEQGVQAEGLTLSGRPDEVITRTAEERGAGLIVMGSHGRTGLDRLLVGSVSERVIGHAQAAVLVVRL
ncbi:MAG: universal stress protein [Ectothiorhodospiraceae bacterium]|jgi:nucleotide-binding universal stress UspA family protein|nr:universal stress protein [Ectothiorhodospiraceae bacterium]